MNEREAWIRNNLFFVGAGVCAAIMAIDGVQSVAPDWRSGVEAALGIFGIIAVLIGKRFKPRGVPS
jgi:hypothetical protein